MLHESASNNNLPMMMGAEKPTITMHSEDKPPLVFSNQQPKRAVIKQFTHKSLHSLPPLQPVESSPVRAQFAHTPQRGQMHLPPLEQPELQQRFGTPVASSNPLSILRQQTESMEKKKAYGSMTRVGSIKVLAAQPVDQEKRNEEVRMLREQLELERLRKMQAEQATTNVKEQKLVKKVSFAKQKTNRLIRRKTTIRARNESNM